MEGLIIYLSRHKLFNEFANLLCTEISNSILLNVLNNVFTKKLDNIIDENNNSVNVDINEDAYLDSPTSNEVTYSYTADEATEATILTDNIIVDITKPYIDSHCIYFLRLYAAGALNTTKPVYKYGKTKRINNRMKKYSGKPFSIEKIIPVNPLYMTQIENAIKYMAKGCGEYTTYINLHELIITTDIGKYYELVQNM
jgi:hypothetical protein